MPSEKVFSLPQVLVLSFFVLMLGSLSGWVLNLEIRKADRSEIIGKSYRENLERTLDMMQRDLQYIRVRVDQHMDEARNGTINRNSYHYQQKGP